MIKIKNRLGKTFRFRKFVLVSNFVLRISKFSGFSIKKQPKNLMLEHVEIQPFLVRDRS